MKIIEEVIEEYNRYRSPEVTAKLINDDENSFQIEFTGTFCYSCGFYDYFEDYLIFLEDHGLKTRISEISETEEGTIVQFQII